MTSAPDKVAALIADGAPPAKEPKKKRGRKPKVAAAAAGAEMLSDTASSAKGSLDKTMCLSIDNILRKRGLTRQQFCGLLAPSEPGHMKPDVLAAMQDSVIDEAIGLHAIAKEPSAEPSLGHFIVDESPEKILLSSSPPRSVPLPKEKVDSAAVSNMFSDIDEDGEDSQADVSLTSTDESQEAMGEHTMAWMHVADELLSADAVLRNSTPLCSEDAATLVAAMTLPQIRTRLADRLHLPDYAVGKLAGMRARLHLMRMLRKELQQDAVACAGCGDGVEMARMKTSGDAAGLPLASSRPAFDAPWLHTYEAPEEYQGLLAHSRPPTAPRQPETDYLADRRRNIPALHHSRFPLHTPPRQEDAHAAGKRKKIVRFATKAKNCLKGALSALAHGTTQAAVQSLLPV